MKLLRAGETVRARLSGGPGPRDYLATYSSCVLRWEGIDYRSVNAFASAMAVLHWNDGKAHTPHGATVCSVLRDDVWVTLKALGVAAAPAAPPVAAPAPAAPKPKPKQSRRTLRRLLAASEDRCAATLMLLEQAEARLATLERIHSQIGSLVAPEVEILSD